MTVDMSERCVDLGVDRRETSKRWFCSNAQRPRPKNNYQQAIVDVNDPFAEMLAARGREIGLCVLASDRTNHETANQVYRLSLRDRRGRSGFIRRSVQRQGQRQIYDTQTRAIRFLQWSGFSMVRERKRSALYEVATRHHLAPFVWTAYLRASVRVWAVRLVRSTPWYPSYANVDRGTKVLFRRMAT